MSKLTAIASKVRSQLFNHKPEIPFEISENPLKKGSPLFNHKPQAPMTKTQTTDQYLIFKVEDFYNKLKKSKFKHPVDRAKALEDLANLAWDEVDDVYEYQSSLRIDP